MKPTTDLYRQRALRCLVIASSNLVQATGDDMSREIELVNIALWWLKAAQPVPETPVDPQYLSERDVSATHGFDTIIGYLAKNHPERLALMDQTPDATMRDGYALRHACRRESVTPMRVPAPPFLQDFGITEVNAYPERLLRERFGD